MSVHTEIEIDPVILERYVGQYQLAPNFVLAVSRKDDYLMVQATWQDRLQVFPESQTKFFYKVVDAQITFQVDEDGQAKGLTLHQNGMDMRAKRIE